MNLPRLNIDLQQLLLFADCKDNLTTYESRIRGTAYIADEKGAVIASCTHGYYMLDAGDIDTLIEELSWIHDEIERRNRG